MKLVIAYAQESHNIKNNIQDSKNTWIKHIARFNETVEILIFYVCKMVHFLDLCFDILMHVKKFPQERGGPFNFVHLFKIPTSDFTPFKTATSHLIFYSWGGVLIYDYWVIYEIFIFPFQGGCLMFSPERCLRVICATFILHNMCMDRGLPIEGDVADEMEKEPAEPEYDDGLGRHDGRIARDLTVQRRFTY